MEHQPITEIAKTVRETLKKELPDCKFSVTVHQYSMGCSMTVALMKSPIQIMADSEKKYVQLNQYQFLDESRKKCCDSLTPEGFDLMRKVTAIALKDHWSDSDAQSDYHNTNFYLHLEVGKWNKPYIEGNLK